LVPQAVAWAEIDVSAGDVSSHGNVTGLAEGADTWAYAYDPLSRLTGVTGPDGARTYGYDPVGNRTSKVFGGTTTSTFDRADRITAAGSAAITVNANGNTTARGSDTFTYDQANRMTSATVGASTETSTYDGDGVRFSRQVDAGPVTRYVTDAAATLPVTIGDGAASTSGGSGSPTPCRARTSRSTTPTGSARCARSPTPRGP
jgi:YD repeat-containing protein